MSHQTGRLFWRRVPGLSILLGGVLLITALPLYAAGTGLSVTPAKGNLQKSVPTMMGSGGYLFQFRVPVNVSLAGDLESHTGSSLMRVSCSVHPANDSNYTKAGGQGSSEFQLSNHGYNGTVTVNITAMEGNNLAHNMTRWRCLLMTKVQNGWSLPVLSQFAQPGSSLDHYGNL